MATAIPHRALDWTPPADCVAASNIAWLMQEVGVDNYAELHAWSVTHFEVYWAKVIERLSIKLRQPYHRIADLSAGVGTPAWLPGAQFNIVESCFSAPCDSAAILFQAEDGAMEAVSVDELKNLAGRVAAGIKAQGWQPGDALAIYMPMTVECVAIYLGILQAGCVAVSIADSFRPKEIETRLRISQAVGIFTQDSVQRAGKQLPMAANLTDITAPTSVVIQTGDEWTPRKDDIAWTIFLPETPSTEIVMREPGDPLNILFSSGTTGDPKAIPWTQSTPLKCGADAHFHHDIRPGDVVVWPTNLGWMMGPWLIFASLLNRATIGLYGGAPTGRGFCQFVQDSRATMLGLVPSIVKAWRSRNATDGLDWSTIRAFSSTGECSNADDMRWLMQQAGGRPVIEYCGGTEIGGGYLTGVVTRPHIAGTFNAKALGMDFILLGEDNQPTENGEVFIIPPSIGLSTSLLNKDHHELYFDQTPTGPNGEILRRHGDQLEALPGGLWRAHGRVDNTMNLGGIKVSSTELERACLTVNYVEEVAAIAVAPDGGPSELVIYAVVAKQASCDDQTLAAAMQSAIKTQLNPLFKIHALRIVDKLPRTASNKVMHRTLRDQFLSTL